MTPEDRKNLIRCPNGCGLTLDFTDLIPCKVCGKVVCGLCRRRLKEASLCKSCHKEKRDELSRLGSEKKT